MRVERNGPRVRSSLARIEEAAKDPEENLLPHILNAVEAYATVGEISDAMRHAFGEHQEAIVI